MNQRYLRECLDYNRDTGVFVWRERPRSHFRSDKAHKIFSLMYAKKPAGGVCKEGYHLIRVDGCIYKAHRLAWLYEHGETPGQWLDHINRIRSDNRICNLRLATAELNSQNASRRKDNKTGIVGVSKHKVTGKWIAQISVNGKPKYLGVFADQKDAVRARQNAEQQYRAVMA